MMPMIYSRPMTGPGSPVSRAKLMMRRAGHLRRRVIARVLRTPPVPPIAPAFMQHLLTIDPILCDAGILAPASSFAIYRKRT
jgi:hypothetical protein